MQCNHQHSQLKNYRLLCTGAKTQKDTAEPKKAQVGRKRLDRLEAHAFLHCSKSGKGIAAIAFSVLVHLALFSATLFATNRVDALMLDHAMTSARFIQLVEPERFTWDCSDCGCDEECDIAPPDCDWECIDDFDAPHAVKEERAATPEVVTGLFAAGMQPRMPIVNRFDDIPRGVASESSGSMCVGHAFDDLITVMDWLDAISAIEKRCTEGWCTYRPEVFENARKSIQYNNTNSDTLRTLLESGCGKTSNLSIDKPKVTGIPDSSVHNVVHKHSADLRACYERELTKDKTLAGSVVLTWLVSPQGTVMKSLVKETTLKNRAVEECVKDSVMKWRFPASKDKGMALVEYPFTFIPSK